MFDSLDSCVIKSYTNKGGHMTSTLSSLVDHCSVRTISTPLCQHYTHQSKITYSFCSSNKRVAELMELAFLKLHVIIINKNIIKRD